MQKRRVLALLLVLVIAAPALAQNRSDKWVATWATALVARAQPGGARGQGAAPAAPQAPVAAAPQAPAGAPTGQAAAQGGRAGGPGGQAPVTVNNQTLRQVVRTSIGGNRVRVVLSNAFGTAPIQIGAAHVALREKDASVMAASTKPLTFAGAAAGTILP